MYKTCKTKQSLSRQKAIETTFLRLLKKRHYDDISVSEICGEMNIPRKAFYRYFNGKEGLLLALITHTLEGYQDYYKSFNFERRTVKSELECYFSFWITEPRNTLLFALLNSGLVEQLFVNSRQLPSNNFIDTSKFLPDETPYMRKQIFNFAISGLLSIMLDWFNGGCKETPREMAEVSCRLLEKPLFDNLENLGIYKV